MRQTENGCVHCDVCYGCGRNKGYEHIYCDVCGDEIEEEENRGEYGEDLCESCYKERFLEENKEHLTYARALELSEETTLEISDFVIWKLGKKRAIEILEAAAGEDFEPDELVEYLGDDYEDLIPKISFQEILKNHFRKDENNG